MIDGDYEENGDVDDNNSDLNLDWTYTIYVWASMNLHIAAGYLL